MNAVDYQERYHKCVTLLGEISRGRVYGLFDSTRLSRKRMMASAQELLDEFADEDRFNAAVEAYVETHYANAIPNPKSPIEC